MCGTCGCETEARPPAAASEARPAAASEARPRKVRIEADLLADNDRVAARNRAYLSERGVLALNLIGAPGAGKTALLEGTVASLGEASEVAVLEGDQETARDAERVRAAGCRVVQKNTGTGCHLDARTVSSALADLEPPPASLLFIENVGNLVCPALFDLGERAKVVVMSATEGEDKPLKYPHVFRAAEVMVLSKADLLPHVPFDADACLENARRINPRLRIFSLSATRGDGMDAWRAWLRGALRESGRRA